MSRPRPRTSPTATRLVAAALILIVFIGDRGVRPPRRLSDETATAAFATESFDPNASGHGD